MSRPRGLMTRWEKVETREGSERAAWFTTTTTFISQARGHTSACLVTKPANTGSGFLIQLGSVVRESLTRRTHYGIARRCVVQDGGAIALPLTNERSMFERMVVSSVLSARSPAPVGLCGEGRWWMSAISFGLSSPI